MATQVVPARIEDVDPSNLRRALGLRQGELTLLAGGPPCQPYIADRQQSQVVDWEFIALRNMSMPSGWREQDKQRHAQALAALAATGYGQNQARTALG